MIKKITLTIIACFIIALAIICLITFYHIIEQEDKYLEEYHTEEMERIKQTLQNAVDLAYAMIDTHYNNALDPISLEKHYGQRLVNIIEIAETILYTKSEAVNKGKLTLEEAQAQALTEISQLRYDNGNGFLWINNTNLPYPRMLMHPKIPKNDILDDPKYNRAQNQQQNLYQVLVKKAQQNGKGFVIYHWDKPSKEGLIKDVPKLAYGKLFPEWNWIIATAIYADEAIREIVDNIQRDLRKMRYNHGIGYFWISTSQKKYLRLIVHPTMPSLEGFLEGNAKTLYSAFVEICETQNGSGFKKYVEPKPDSSGVLREKLTYVRVYKPLGWIVGTNAYLDSIGKAVSEKQKQVEEDIRSLVIKLATVSIFVILLISILSYVMSQYFPWVKSVVKSTAERVKSQTTPSTQPTITEEPTFGHQPAPEMSGSVPAGLLPADDCMKMIQEISKTLITEQNKVIATALQGSQPHQTMEEKSKITNDIKKVIDKTAPSVGEMKQVIERNQVPSQPTSNLGLTQFDNSPKTTTNAGVMQFDDRPKSDEKVTNNLNNMMDNLSFKLEE
jgi:signal transduction histidine kinase